MSKNPELKLKELAEGFSIAMLVTRTTDGGLRGRPMLLAEVDPEGNLWFVSERQSGKIEELAADAHVAVTMQSMAQFVSVSGTAHVVEDRARLDRVWKLEWKVWFPGGKDDPNMVMLRVDATSGEYWDNSGTSGIKYLIAAGKALLTGAKPDVGNDPNIHGKVQM